MSSVQPTLMARPPRPSALYSTIALLSWPVARLVFRYEALGREHLPPEGGFVLAAGHVSNLDPWPLGLGLWPNRFLRFMAKSELFWFPLGPVLHACGAFKVHRGRADREAIATAVRLARDGHVIAMFPEGTRRRKGLRKRFRAQAHSGAARIAIEAAVPLVPAGIRGTDGLHRLRPWRVRYGAPVPVGADAAETTERLMAAIHELEASLGGDGA
ncbi:MAG TPA: lysophospholipid acyltransferase family protein [Gaiellaceae bacterium]|nr:lysophospholipid acyltransferase family protein [Gaiellaceae bacterium]